MSSYPRNNRFHQSPARRTRAHHDEQGFTCRHCGLYVTCAPAIAGVQNRNHCPYCLWSRHLDGLSAGDRLAGCRATMQPIGLTTKRTRNKYASASSGELMLIHQCTMCAKIVINRIAADDSAAAILALFEESIAAGAPRAAEVEANGVAILGARDALLVRQRLFGASRAEMLLGQEAA